jgi:N-carbamoyl-L-amino-acid hydrolase
MHNLTINAERLWREVMETAAIGATPKGGICRLTLTDLDRQHAIGSRSAWRRLAAR